jgi:hypothetical protein
MTQIFWKTAINGNFATASDWSTGTVPGPGDDAVINAAGTYKVTSSVNETVAERDHRHGAGKLTG